MVKIPPKLEELIPPAALGKVLDVLNQPAIANTVREALNRVGLKDVNPVEQVQEAWQQARHWVGSIANRFGATELPGTQTINAAGVLFLPDSVGVPASPIALDAYVHHAGSFHNRQLLEEQCQTALVGLTKSDGCVLVNSLSAALQLVASGTNCGDGILISRADSVRIPGFGDIRTMLSLGCKVVEVGATNGAVADDWKAALTGHQAIALVSPNSLSGEEARQQRVAAIDAARAAKALVIDVLIDGCLQTDLVCKFPSVKEYLATSDLVVLPLDGLLASTSGAVILGSSKALANIPARAVQYGWNLNGPSLASTLVALQRVQMANPMDSAVIDCLKTSTANLKDRCRRLALQISGSTWIKTAEVIERPCPLGPSPWTGYSLNNAAVAATPQSDIDSVLKQLGSAKQPIRAARLNDQVLIDLRFVLPTDDHQIVAALQKVEAT